MNLAVRGNDGQIAHGDTLHDDRHPDLKADSIPAFNISDRGGDLALHRIGFPTQAAWPPGAFNMPLAPGA